ncbi:TatD family hydrolase [Lysobacter sp. A03]|uniref:TatD family hydrolase n=1 Tax=Lysobacter sp. A03 TaxID=1199154 RepID=UPI0005B6EDF5|nr:TatD family hydrolase [Lysobacter sp. A03]KIQ98415.1 putative deoxyribonuclease YjjV [Lysobacter sp. A03]
MLVDTHCHLDAPEFDDDRTEVIERARTAGVTRQVVPATIAAGWPGLRDVCASGDGLHAAYGLHPMFLDAHRREHIVELKQWIEREKPVAVGECGLDFYIPDPDREEQAWYFDAQLKLARDFDLPLIVHARRSVDQVIAAIRRIGNLRGVVHSFPGSQQQADILLENGFMLGIGGPVTYERAKRLRKIVATMPLEWLLLETDAPDQPDAAHRGKRNEPARITRVLETIAQLRDISADELAAATSSNAERLFGLPPARHTA